ncbi:MAG: hypothetical protein GX622_11930 [Bacteroidales bacterium]|nr:hypothetical protein [Bacteroidales bacterium]
MIMAIDDHVFYLQQEWGIETKPKTAEQPAPELQENGRYRYYSTQRPVDIGTFPKPADNKPVEIHNYDSRIPVENGTMLAWGYLEYAKPLTEKEASDYELKPAPARTTRDETLSSQEEKPSVLMELAEKKGKVTRKAPSKLTHRKKEETR